MFQEFVVMTPFSSGPFSFSLSLWPTFCPRIFLPFEICLLSLTPDPILDAHFYPFQDLSWDDLVAKKIEAPFKSLGDGGWKFLIFSRPPRSSPPKRGMLAFFETTTPHFSAKNWVFRRILMTNQLVLGFCLRLQNDIDMEKTSSLGSTCSWIDDPMNPLMWEILGKHMKMIKWIVVSMLFYQGKKHRRPTKRSTQFLLHISRLPTRPAVKGATDTSNFDDYPDSDQEPPAVNALGTLGRKMDEG